MFFCPNGIQITGEMNEQTQINSNNNHDDDDDSAAEADVDGQEEENANCWQFLVQLFAEPIDWPRRRSARQRPAAAASAEPKAGAEMRALTCLLLSRSAGLLVLSCCLLRRRQGSWLHLAPEIAATCSRRPNRSSARTSRADADAAAAAAATGSGHFVLFVSN